MECQGYSEVEKIKEDQQFILSDYLYAPQLDLNFLCSPHGDHKANVGLNLKFNRKNEEVPGYTKKVGNEWMYSSAVEQLLAEYLERYSVGYILNHNSAL